MSTAAHTPSRWSTSQLEPTQFGHALLWKNPRFSTKIVKKVNKSALMLSNY